MNLSSVTVPHSAVKASKSEPLGTVQSPARSDVSSVAPQDFGKYFSQIMKASVPTRHPDALRQDLAAHDSLIRTGKETAGRDQTAEPRPELARDSRFSSAKEQASVRQDPPEGDAPRTAAKAAAKASAQRKLSEANNRSDVEVTETSQERTEEAPQRLPADEAAGLKTLALSPHLQIITAEQPATTDESLADYARQMGLDEGTIHQLLNPNTSKLGISLTHSKLGTELNPFSGLPQAPEAAPSAATPVLAATSQPASALLATTVVAGTPFEKQLLNAQDQSMSAQAPSDATDSLKTLAALKTGEWKGLDNVMLQISSMSNNTSAMRSQPVSSLAVLSMMDSQLSSEAIEALAQSFEDAPISDADATTGQGLSGLDAGRSTSSGKATPATAAQALPTPMAETYEKLSAKLSTELAARMHQQINDGHWKMKFALKPASLGAVDIQLEMRDGKLAALFQADNPLTQDLLQHGSQRLKHALSELGLTQTSVQVGQGQGQNAGQSSGQSSNQPGSSQFGDNHGQANAEQIDAATHERPRRSSLSQFDLYA